MNRDSQGRFLKGIHYAPQTEFKKGAHWRKAQIYWNREWLDNEYTTKQRSCSDIASTLGCTTNNIHYFLHKFGIRRRTISENRKIKYWGAVGPANPMYGKRGQQSPGWNGGHSPERQRYYSTYEWKKLKREILERDDFVCQKCGVYHSSGNILVIHHIKPWSRYPELRFDPDNLVTLCKGCHIGL